MVRLIEGVFLESDKTYGYRAIKKALEQKGTEISEYKIRKIMRENGFYPETRKKYKPYRKGKVYTARKQSVRDQLRRLQAEGKQTKPKHRSHDRKR